MSAENSQEKKYSFLSPFTEGDYGDGLDPLTALELKILNVLEEIKNKKSWNTKINDENIRNKWIAELTPHFESRVIEYAIAELLHYSKIFTGKIVPGPVDRIYIADDYILPETAQKFADSVQKLENINESDKDWHPGSNNQVLDLVHPSLYPLMYGISRASSTDLFPTQVESWRSAMGKGKIIDYEKPYAEEFTRRPWEDPNMLPLIERYRSKKYQWLPSEFQVTDGKVDILSYINNLHPEKHADMYATIESIFEQFIPLLSNCLTDSCNENKEFQRIDPGSYFIEDIDQFKKRFKAKKLGIEVEQIVERSDDEDSEDEDFEDECYDAYDEEKIVEEPKDVVFSPETIPEKKIVIDLNNTRLQVIVKLANIILTPENPDYQGGVWHVEGMQNENIVATGIYYYDQDNVTESSLAFRTAICEPGYEQGDIRGVFETYRLKDEEPLNQYLGKVSTLKGRCLVFPNLYQHQVQPFKLEDKNSTGFRKILCFFLVDPTDRVYSTANIPPQQREWFELEINKSESKLTQIPGLISEKVFDSLDWPIDLKEAKKHREELMKERKYLVNSVNEGIFERDFSLCEH